jgi:hypothetical protein
VVWGRFLEKNCIYWLLVSKDYFEGQLISTLIISIRQMLRDAPRIHKQNTKKKSKKTHFFFQNPKTFMPKLLRM